ncbi:MAG: aminotransferase class I/II-fold pyridoxal phosphate-dependent enzyme [Clostridia bacterium]|nr:aminotransferase class I/II-fold pyridoxal phosphate-dependent enzyme [Clostridia bacterium]
MIANGTYVHGGDVYQNRVALDFSANVNPLGTPEPVKAAIRQAAEELDRYPDPYCTALRKALSERLGVSPEAIVCGNGGAELIYQIAAALKPKRTLLPVPSFADYEAALAAVGCEPTFVPLRRETGFALDDSILDAITESVDLLMLCSPNNPTGRSIEPKLLRRILDRCRETGTWLFLDESFYGLTDADKQDSLIPELFDDDRVLILRAFTKTYGMAGVRLGCCITKNRAMTASLTALSQPWNVSTVAQAAGVAALTCDEWVQKTRTLIAAEKAYLIRALQKLGVNVLYGDANYLLLSGVPTLYEALLQNGILVRDCVNYRGLEKGDVRIAIRTHAENEALIAAIAEVSDARNGN